MEPIPTDHTDPADPTAPAERTDPTDPARYRHWAEEQVRFADLDPLGHVNNNAVGVYFESGRVAFYRATRLHEGTPDRRPVVRRIVIEFLAELHFPAALRVGTRPVRIGRSSITFRQGLFTAGRCVATAETVSVMFDLAARRPVSLSDAQRAALAALM